MNILQKTVRWAFAKAAGIPLSLTDPKGWRPLFGGSGVAGKTVNEDTAMQVSTVFACVRILAQSVAQLPLGVYQREKNGNAVKVDHPLAEILVDSPNADMTSVEFREAGQTNLGLAGNAYYWRDQRGDGNIASLYPIVASDVIPQRNRDGDIEYKIRDNGRWTVVPREKIWHVKGFGSTGLVGYSPIGMQRNALSLAMAAEEFGGKLFTQGARPSAVVKIPQWLKPEQREAARTNLQDLAGGNDQAHKLMLLEGGMEFDAAAGMIPPEDLQLLQLRRFQVAEICRIYGIPPHMVADMERATHSNIEEMSLEFVVFTLLPWLRRWEASADRWLLKPADRSRYFVRFNFEGLLRANTQARAEYLRTMVANGIMSRNEARGKENLNRIDGQGMDDFTVQSNMISVDDLQAIVDAMRGNAAQP